MCRVITLIPTWTKDTMVSTTTEVRKLTINTVINRTRWKEGEKTKKETIQL